jgi:hypothetical protein
VLAAIRKEALNHNLILINQNLLMVLESTKVKLAVMSKEKRLLFKFSLTIVA